MTEHQTTPTLTPTPTTADASSWLCTVDDITALIAAVGPYPVVLDRHQRRWTIVEITGDRGDRELRARPLAGPNQLVPPTGTPAAAALLEACGPLLPTTALSDPTFAAVLHSDIDHVNQRTADLLWGRLPAREWVGALAAGWADTLVPDHPAARWQWYAQILDSPLWGMATIATGHRELCLEVAMLCRTVSALPAETTHIDSDDEYAQLQQQWRAVDAAVMSAIGDHDPTPACRAANDPACDRGVFEALDTIIEITTDAFEWLRADAPPSAWKPPSPRSTHSCTLTPLLRDEHCSSLSSPTLSPTTPRTSPSSTFAAPSPSLPSRTRSMRGPHHECTQLLA